jgi:membrane-bound serine protease (ClpP class)
MGLIRRIACGTGAAAAILAMALGAAADTLVLKDGRRIEGRLVSDDGAAVVFEMRSRGAALRCTFARDQVASIEAEAREGPSYYPLPFIGTIGRDERTDQFVTAAAFREALEEVRRVRPAYVVLVIDSRGGALADLTEILEIIRESTDVQFVAYVKQALSAASAVALACPRIYMAPGATIGAAVPFQRLPDGTPAVIEEKMESAVRAMFRAAAATGGHSELLVRGMMEAEVRLALVERGGKPVIVEARGPGGAGELIKERGTILTLTAAEGVRLGLATGIADSVEAIGENLGHAAWHKADDLAWHHMVNAAKVLHQRDVEQARRIQQHEERQARLQKLRPDLERVRSELTDVRAQAAAQDVAGAQLLEQWRKESGEAEAERRASIESAETMKNPDEWKKKAMEAYQLRIGAIRERLNPQIEAVRKSLTDLRAREESLVAEWNRLVAVLEGR